MKATVSAPQKDLYCVTYNAYVRYNLKKLLKMLNTDREQKAKIKVKKSDNFEQFQIHRCCIQNL